MMTLSEHIKLKRKLNGLSQVELDKVNDVLALFGEYLGPVKTDKV